MTTPTREQAVQWMREASEKSPQSWMEYMHNFSSRAFASGAANSRDCRTCMNINLPSAGPHCVSISLCENGHLYKPMLPLQLWRQE